jgi:hypothetical protein
MKTWIALPALMCIALFLSLPVRAADGCLDRLVALWGAQVLFGPEVRGELTVIHRGTSWNACLVSD